MCQGLNNSACFSEPTVFQVSSRKDCRAGPKSAWLCEILVKKFGKVSNLEMSAMDQLGLFGNYLLVSTHNNANEWEDVYYESFGNERTSSQRL